MFEKLKLLGVRIPKFTDDEICKLKGSSDFFGFNFYTSKLISACPPPAGSQLSLDCGPLRLMGICEEVDPQWPGSGSKWLKVTPFGIRKELQWVRDTYNNPAVYITENGYSDRTGALEDTERIAYYKSYINEVLKAILLDGCNVQGYTAWSLMDNFEWARGYTERFGLYHVDFTDPNRKRTAKASAKFYADVVKMNGFE